MSSLHASLKSILSTATKKKWKKQFFRHSRAANSAVIGQLNNSREKVATPFFLDAQGEVTLLSMVGSGWISNSFKLLCMSSLPVSMKRIRSKTVEKKWKHRFSHYKSMGIFSDAKGQLTPQSVVGSCRNPSSSELSCMSLLPASMKRIRWKTATRKSGNTVFLIITIWELSIAMEKRSEFGCDRPAGCRDIHV